MHPATNRERGSGPSRHDAGLRRVADLRTHQRLLEKMVPRHWNPCPQGELLAEIDTPEVDQQLLQSRADLNTAKRTLASLKSRRHAIQSLLRPMRQQTRSDNAAGDSKPRKPSCNPRKLMCAAWKRRNPSACIRTIRGRDHPAQRGHWHVNQRG